MKKTLLCVLSLVIPYLSASTTAIANTPQLNPSPSFFNNVHFGIGLGLEYLHADAGVKIQPPNSLLFIESKQSHTGKHFQVAPQIEIGKAVGKDFYLGALVSWRYSGLKNDINVPIINYLHFSHKFILNHYTDILFKGGYNLNPCTRIFGLFGPTIINWTHKSQQVLNGQVIDDQFQINKTSLGLCVGIGFEYLYRKDYGFSIDYTYHLQRAKSKSRFMSVTRGANISTGDVNKKVDLSFSTIAVRFTKYF